MQLITMHKILIRTGIGGALLFCAWSFYQWTVSNEVGPLIMGLVSGGLAAGMAGYLRQFIRKQAERPGASAPATDT